MNDQASALRQIVSNIKRQRTRNPNCGARVVSVTSGKGGVGKTSFTVNLALALSKKGLRVLVVDADFGLSNVDVVFGLTPEYDLSSVINYKKEIRDIIVEGPLGVRFISGGSGIADLINLTDRQLGHLTDSLLAIENLADVIIFDTGAGINSNIMRLVSASDEVIVITTPEPTAIMDAYAVVKMVSTSDERTRVRVVINRAVTPAEANDTMSKFIGVVRLYLKADVEPLGFVLDDPSVVQAVRHQTPFLIGSPKSASSRNIETIAWKFLELEPPENTRGGLRRFFQNVLDKRGLQPAETETESVDRESIE